MQIIRKYSTILSLIIFAYCLPLQSCSKYTVTTSQKLPADIRYKKKVSVTYLWGIINKPHSVIDTTCGKGGLSEVKVISNPGYSLINIASLGIVHLVKVEWKCQKEPPVIGY